MAKISDFKLTRESGFYYVLSYKERPVGRIECDGDEWTAYGSNFMWNSSRLTELFDKYFDGGKRTPSEVFSSY